MHWYSLDASAQFSKRNDIELLLDKSIGKPASKEECRPHLIDWNRDGHDDVVVLMRVYKFAPAKDGPDPVFQLEFKLLVNTDSADRKKQIEKGRLAKSKLPKDEGWGVPPNGPDLQLKLRNVSLESKSFDADNELEMEFADFDGDGNFDIVYFENDWYRGMDEKQEHYVSKFIGTGVYWMRNTTSKGEPKFSAPAKLFGSKKQIRSIAVVDFDGDGRKEVAINSDRKVRLLVRE